jgi:hypothetical protein
MAKDGWRVTADRPKPRPGRFIRGLASAFEYRGGDKTARQIALVRCRRLIAISVVRLRLIDRG